MFTGVRWFSAEDSTGKVYFYEENGNESCWALPNVSQSIQDPGSSNTSTPEPSVKDSSEKSPSSTGISIDYEMVNDVFNMFFFFQSKPKRNCLNNEDFTCPFQLQTSRLATSTFP